MKQTHRVEPGGNSEWPLDPDSVGNRLLDRKNQTPVRRTEELSALLETLKNRSMPAVTRFRSVEHCARAVAALRHDLNKSLAGVSLPLPPEKDELSRKHARIHRLLARCYTRVATEISAKGPRGAREAEYLLKSCHAGIAALGEYLLINYERYSKIRPGIWLDVHRLYDLAVSEGIQNTPLEPRSQPPKTVEHTYKRVLLLGLSDPFHQPFRSLTTVYAKLDAWASLVSLTTETINTSRCVFMVDPALDRPAMPALPRSRIRPEFNERWLNTRRLVDHLKLKHQDVTRNAVGHMDHAASLTQELDSIEQLRRMIVHWGIHPIRSSERRTAYQKCEMVIGLKSVCIALNDFEPLAVERAVPRSVFADMIAGRFKEVESPTVDSVQISNQWEIADESDRGFKVVADTSRGCPGVAVGDLVAIRTSKSGAWAIGNVHWAQTDDHNSLSVGVKKIQFTAEPAAIFRLGTDKPLEQTRCAGLLLNRESDRGCHISLICDKLLYFPTATYLVRYRKGENERVVEASNVLLTSRSFVWFEAHKPRADTKQKVLDLISPG